MTYREFHYRWVFNLKSSPEQIWPFVADTNRFNRDTGVPMVETERASRSLRNARRRVRLSIYGMPVEWEEQPFEWLRPVRFGVDRVYSKGPMVQMRVLAELSADASGTRLTYDVWARPRNLLGMIAIPLQIGVISKRKFRAAFEKYDQIALPDVPSSDSAVLARAVADRPRLVVLKRKLLADVETHNAAMLPQAKRIADRLVDLVQEGDNLSVARIRPYQLAEEWRESRRDVLEACLRATRTGLLDLQWDLICPMCRGATDSGISLRDLETTVHCDSCKIDFTINFDRFVELTFRPNAAVRRVEVGDYCIGSPQRTPHVVAQQLLKVGEKRRITLPLEEGNYRLRALELQGAQAANVSATGVDSAAIVISHKGWSDQPLNLAARSSLDLDNQTEAEQLFILERMAWSDLAATAAEVTALQVFRDLFSTEALRPGQQISVGTLTVLFTDLRNSTRLYREIGDATAFGRVMNHFDVLKKTINDNDGAIVKTIGDAVMAVFRSPAAALLAMIEAQQVLSAPSDGSLPLSLKAGLHSGPCIAVTLNDRLDYFGSTVNMAARLEGLSSGTDVIISRAVFEEDEVSELLDSGRFEATPFEMTLKGFEDEQVTLWRVTRKVND
jgi:adenylate cyclase